MTAFHPITPMKAVELVEAAGLPDGRLIIADYCAAGSIKSYAQVTETVEVGGQSRRVLDAAISSSLWKRMIREAAVADVWLGGTVRLIGSDLVGGAPEVSITGIGFKPDDVQRLLDRHHDRVPVPKQAKHVARRLDQLVIEDADAAPVARQAKMPDLSAIPAGALLATIKQAQAALGYGRTKINDLMNAGRLVRVEDVGGVRITVASIHALAGLGN